MGYSHAYLDPEAACLKSLSVFPLDHEIEVVSGQAWEEAVILLGILGIQVDDISPPPNSTPTPKDTNPPSTGNDNMDKTHKHDSDHDEEETTTARLQRMIDLQELPIWSTVDPGIQGRMHALTCAAMALDVEDQEKL